MNFKGFSFLGEMISCFSVLMRHYAVSTEFERKEYLAKMKYYPNTWHGAPGDAGPPEGRGHIGAGPNATASV